MKITVLGSGSAYGIPYVLNEWGVVDANNPFNRRLRPSILMQIDDKNIVVDAGPDFREQINRSGIKDIHSVFITHGHYDHIGGIPDLVCAGRVLEHPIDVYASKETMDELKLSFRFLFKDTNKEKGLEALRWNEIPQSGKFEASGLDFDTFVLPHHNLNSSGFRYNNFAYITDWQQMTKETLEHLQGLDLLLIECNNGLNPRENGHSDIEKVMAIVDAVKPKKVVLCHISVRTDHDELSAGLPDNISVAYDGMVLDVE